MVKPNRSWDHRLPSAPHRAPGHEGVDVAVCEHYVPGLEGGDDVVLEPVGEVGGVEEREGLLAQRELLLGREDARCLSAPTA